MEYLGNHLEQGTIANYKEYPHPVNYVSMPGLGNLQSVWLDQKAKVVHLQDLHPRPRLSAVGGTLSGRLGKSSTGRISICSIRLNKKPYQFKRVKVLQR